MNVLIPADQNHLLEECRAVLRAGASPGKIVARRIESEFEHG